MGETLGIAHNVFEKMERERDRKERMKKYEDWQKLKVKKQQKLKEMKAKIKVEELRRNEGSVPNGLELEAGTSGADVILEPDGDEDNKSDMDLSEDGTLDLEPESPGNQPSRQNSSTVDASSKEARRSDGPKSRKKCGKCVVQ